jgi:hypothetical protein
MPKKIMQKEISRLTDEFSMLTQKTGSWFLVFNRTAAASFLRFHLFYNGISDHCTPISPFHSDNK